MLDTIPLSVGQGSLPLFKENFLESTASSGVKAKLDLLLFPFFVSLNDLFISFEIISSISFCKYFDAFQDLPFSIPGTYKYLAKSFPGSKFILTVRDSDDQWFRSMKNYYGGSANVVKEADGKSEMVFRWYRYKFFLKDFLTTAYSVDLFSESWKEIYNDHNRDVKEYFNDRPEDLLCINVSDEDSYKKLCKFLNKEPKREVFLWMNKTKPILETKP